MTSCPTTIEQLAERACERVIGTSAEQLLDTAGIHSAGYNIVDHHSSHRQHTPLIMAALTLRENSPTYDTVASRLLLSKLSSEVSLSLAKTQTALTKAAPATSPYQQGFLSYINKGIKLGLIQPEIIAYDLPFLAKKIIPTLDLNLTYAELHNLSNQLLLRYQGRCFELPQYAFMRIAIALSIKENKGEARVAEIYRLLSVRSYSRISATIFREGTISKPYKILNSHTSAEDICIKKTRHLKLVN